MNLHIDKRKHLQLINSNIIGKFVIGSHLYGLNDNNSDRDYLVIYHPFKNQLFSPFNNHHQFQYKDDKNNIDWNYVDIITFVKNLVKGDSTINYELLHSDQFKRSDLGFLSDNTTYFRTYSIIKAYLGFADRDAKMLNQRKTDADKISGLIHIERSFKSAQAIFNNTFTLVDNEIIEYKKNLKEYTFKEVPRLMMTRDKIKDFRDSVLNKALADMSIPRYLNPVLQRNIDLKLSRLIKVQHDYLNIDDIYNANELPEIKY